MCWKKTQGVTWISRVLLKRKFPDAVLGCPSESSVWPRPNTCCLFHMPWLPRCMNIGHSPLPASEVSIPTDPGERGWIPTGPLPSRWRSYASMAEHPSTISVPAKEPHPDSKCTPECTAPCPTWCLPAPSCMEYKVALTPSSSSQHCLLHGL